MKTILIDPHTRTITEADHDGSLEAIDALLHCDMITTVTIDRKGGTLFLDDEGLLKDLRAQAFFKLDTYADPLAGYAMVVGTDYEGETVATPYTVEDIAKRVTWTTLDEIRRSL